MRRIHCFATIVVVLASGTGCYDTIIQPTGDDTGTSPDTFSPDTSLDSFSPDTWMTDTPTDPFPETMLDTIVVDSAHDDPFGVPPCPTAPADHPTLGQPCLSDLDCAGGSYPCYTETVEIYDGEVYVDWPGGTCVRIGPGTAGCDITDPDTCPAGTRCLYMYTHEGDDHHACLDACSAMDSSWVPYDWACGCRQGYRCDLETEVCLPGCSNDRECCEIWHDADEDGMRDAGEVQFDEDCTNWCDGDDDEEWRDDWQASWSCINNGDMDADCHSECLFDSDCPPDYECLNEIEHTDPETGEPLYPGGLCIKTACHLVGRGCFPEGSCDCVSMRSSSAPDYQCRPTCVTGEAGGCREGYTCRPYPSDYWLSPSPSNGLCVPWIEGGHGDLGDPCLDDRDCASPLGLGFCSEFIDSPSFCTISCDETLAEGPEKICGAASAPGEPAPGACWSGYCLTACDTPSGPVGDNGCPGEMACFDNGLSAYGFYSYSDPDGTPPAGFCFVACTSNDWCLEAYGIPLTCDLITGQCG